MSSEGERGAVGPSTQSVDVLRDSELQPLLLRLQARGQVRVGGRERRDLRLRSQQGSISGTVAQGAASPGRSCII